MKYAGPVKLEASVVTADAEYLTPSHLTAVGADAASIAVAGMHGCPEFEATSWHDQETLDVAKLESETVEVARGLLARQPHVGAILLECSLLPPYAAAVQRVTGLPVFDFTHLVTMVHGADGHRNRRALQHNQ